MKKRILIGRQDIADFPDLQLNGIQVKIDSGAYTSSFHCHKIEVLNIDGTEKLRCFFLDPEHDEYIHKEYIFERFSRRKVRSSNNLTEERFSVKTSIKLFNRVRQIELTLTQRGNMRFPVLLGRKFISKKFVVDSSLKNLSANNSVIKIEY